ncbi:MAG: hypothetical protein AABX83_02895 [Nanoarchaeota archaeon]
MKSNNFNFTLQRAYLFVFFEAGYTFLSWWIALNLIFFFPFAIAGIIFYLITCVFHIAVTKLIARNEPSKNKFSKSTGISIFFIILISFCVLVIFGVYGLEWIAIKYLQISKKWFSLVNIGLSILSLLISFAISFATKVNENHNKPQIY